MTGEDLAGLPYAECQPRLLAHGYGLWDVLASHPSKGFRLRPCKPHLFILSFECRQIFCCKRLC